MENGGITSIFHLSPRPSEHPYDHKYHKNRPDVGQYKAGQAYDAEKDAHYKNCLLYTSDAADDLS